MEAYDSSIKKLVKERLAAMPPNVSFSVGEFGDFTPAELIKEVDKGSDVGEAVIEMQLTFIRSMPKLLRMAEA